MFKILYQFLFIHVTLLNCPFFGRILGKILFMVGKKEPISLPVEGRPTWKILNEIKAHLSSAQTHCNARGRPFVTLAYAQSLDGSIASGGKRPLALSSAEAMALTHALRAAHDAILVGIGCVLADNPRLTVRLIPGRSPQPVVVDSTLRCPLTANLLMHNGTSPWIVATNKADKKRQKLLEAAGATVIRLESPSGVRIDLSTLLKRLSKMGVSSIMVEGGAHIITSFLAERLVDQVVVTIAPLLVGGLRAVRAMRAMESLRASNRSAESHPSTPFPRLVNTSCEKVGDDFVIRGDPDWASL
jgi:3,4-dihydroxy 2-butanone 4-phosphate synthase/GTP cyclohydrolase II